MTNLTTIPQEDWKRTSLSQEWDGEVWTMFLQSAPSFTMPVDETCYVVIQPNWANAKLAEFDSIDTGNNTINITNVTLLKGAGINNPTGVTYPTNTEVLISDNYQFWADIQTAINSKVNADDGLWVIYADPTARDAAITSPSNWMQVYVTSLWLFTDYIAWAWTNRATGSTPNASLTVAGKVEISTQAEFDAETTTGWTGALVVPQVDVIIWWAALIWITWEVRLWTTVTAPTSWLIANGATLDSVADTSLAALFAVIGTTFWGTWADDFDLPDLQGNVPVGVDGVTFSALWVTGWAETHTLVESEIPAHTHTTTIAKDINPTDGSDAAGCLWQKTSPAGTPSPQTSATTGWGGSHNNLQPYLVMNYIIKK